MLHYRPMPTYLLQQPPPALVAATYEARIAALKAAAGCDWVVVYGDREHVADITFLSNFYTRFEEAILVLGPKYAVIVGNEGLGYVRASRRREMFKRSWCDDGHALQSG